MKLLDINTGTSARYAAIQIMSAWIQNMHFPDRMIPGMPEHSFVVSLVYTAVKMRRVLEWAIARHLRKKAYGHLEATLLVGACQILLMPEIPLYASLNTTVEAAKRMSKKSTPLVNAVLRQLANARGDLLAELECQPLGVRCSHPDTLITRWQNRHGATDTELLCLWNNKPAGTTLALLPHHGITADDYALRAADAGITVTPHPFAPETHLAVPHGMPRLDTFPGYKDGHFIVQEPSAQTAVDLLDVRPGLNVLDACAAPGGKTLQIASRMVGGRDGKTGAPVVGGRLVALEKHADRFETLRENIARCGMRNIDARIGDAAAEPPDGAALFDRILLDLPCSNTGVLRRRPDARWRFSTQRLNQLRTTQANLLKAGLARLAPHGKLVYSTCSLEPEENRALVESVAAETPGVHISACREHLPFKDQVDGMFAACVERGP